MNTLMSSGVSMPSGGRSPRGATGSGRTGDGTAVVGEMTRLVRHRAMGTSIEVLGPAGMPRGYEAVASVIRRFEVEEQRFSRFCGDSELSSVNRAAGRRTRVSPTYATVLGLALEAARTTGGSFDPTVHDALTAAHDCGPFREDPIEAVGTLQPLVPCGRWREIKLDDDTVLLPEGVHVDLGGILKGWTADRAAEDALASGLPWVLVNAGGDLRIAGDAPMIDVGIEDPLQACAVAHTVRISAGAVATSSVSKRAWGFGRHHVIDPATGAPADIGTIQATMWAPTCAEAEVRATAALLTGRPALRSTPGVLISATETIVSFPVETAA